MPPARPAASPLSGRAATILGAVLVLVALLLAEFATFPATGHRINSAEWPPEAQAILKESPGTPITSEQWRRIDRALRPYGGYSYGQVPYWSQTAAASWWWFLLAPLGATLLLAIRRGVTALVVGLLVLPSVLTIAVAFALAR